MGRSLPQDGRRQSFNTLLGASTMACEMRGLENIAGMEWDCRGCITASMPAGYALITRSVVDPGDPADNLRGTGSRMGSPPRLAVSPELRLRGKGHIRPLPVLLGQPPAGSLHPPDRSSRTTPQDGACRILPRQPRPASSRGPSQLGPSFSRPIQNRLRSPDPAVLPNFAPAVSPQRLLVCPRLL